MTVLELAHGITRADTTERRNRRPSMPAAVPDAARYTMSSPSANSTAAALAPVSFGICSATYAITLPRSMPSFAISACAAMMRSNVSADGVAESAV